MLETGAKKGVVLREILLKFEKKLLEKGRKLIEKKGQFAQKN